jgi:hypothetical protein
VTGTNSEQQQLRMLAVRRLWRGRRGVCVARLQSSSGTRASSPVLLDSGDGDPLDRSAVQGAVPVLTLPFVHRHLYCRTVDTVIHLTGLQCKQQCLFSHCHLFVISQFCKVFISMNVSFVLVKMWPSVCNHRLDFNAAFVGENLSRLTSPVSTYVAYLDLRRPSWNQF